MKQTYPNNSITLVVKYRGKLYGRCINISDDLSADIYDLARAADLTLKKLGIIPVKTKEEQAEIDELKPIKDHV